MSERLTDEECEDLLIAAHTVEPMHHVGNTLIAAVERILASRDARLAAVEALIETLPRNEFGDEHYLAVDAAYGNVVTQLRAALHPDVESPSVERGQS